MSTWLNEAEIDTLRDRYRDDPVLGPAARYLSDYRDLVNSMSDGWCHWARGTRPAAPLSTLLVNANCYHQGARHLLPSNYQPPTLARVRRAIGRIERFILNEPQMGEKTAPSLREAPVFAPGPLPAFEVWHAQSGVFREAAEDHILVARVTLEEGLFLLGSQNEVLGWIFERTNHHPPATPGVSDQSWTENLNVQALIENPRSSSVGDCIRNPAGRVFRVLALGFREEPDLVPMLRSTAHIDPQKGWSDAPNPAADPA